MERNYNVEILLENINGKLIAHISNLEYNITLKYIDWNTLRSQEKLDEMVEVVDDITKHSFDLKVDVL